jgi:hypothetical protein
MCPIGADNLRYMRKGARIHYNLIKQALKYHIKTWTKKRDNCNNTIYRLLLVRHNRSRHVLFVRGNRPSPQALSKDDHEKEGERTS